MTIVWSVMAAMVAVYAEYLYRTLPGPWLSYLWIWIPMQLAIGYCICQLVKTPGMPLVGAFIVWSLAIMGMRTAVTLFILKDTVSVGTWVAVGLMICARFAQQVWR